MGSSDAGAEGDDILRLSLQLGNLHLEGRGQRGGLRCRTFVGKVFEEDVGRGVLGEVFEGNTVVGRFTMRLALPMKTDSSALEQQYRQRILEKSAGGRSLADPSPASGVLSARACVAARAL